MTGPRSPLGVLAGLIVALALGLASPTAVAAAEACPQRDAPGSAAQAGAGQQGPVVRFDSAGIGLDEVVRLALRHDPALRRQEAAVQSSEGALQEQTGAFDFALAGNSSYNYQIDELTETYKTLYGFTDTVLREGAVGVELGKPFRWGLSVTPYVGMNYEQTGYRGPLGSFAASSLPGLFTLRAGVGARLPLGRGFGARATGAAEQAAVHGRDASRLSFEHQSAVTALTAVLAYWDLRAAQEQAAIVERLVESQVKLTALTNDLIEAGELPKVEIARAQAAEARARAQLNEARRTAYEARVSLALAMGVAVTPDDATLPRARDEFPAPPDPPALAETAVDRLAQAAAVQRRDVGAASALERAGSALEQGARTNLRPRFDVVAGSFATARDEGTAGRAWARWIGPSAEIAIEAERPIGNNVSRGQLRQREAELNDARITAADLRRQAVLGVIEAAHALLETGERVRQAEAAVGFLRATVEAEIERFRTGEATLIDTVLTQQQQTDAERALVSARQVLGQQIARLRFESGLLLPDGTVSADHLTTVPVPGGRRP